MSEYVPDEVLLSTKTDYPTKIFISYAHAQDEIVTKIYEGLKKRGHDVWIDESEIKYGDDWREKIANGIESCNGVLSFLSKEAVRENGVCLDELAIAIGVKYGNIHTVLLQKEEDVKPPAQLTHRQWLDMSEWKDKLAQGDAVFMPWFQPMLADIIRKIESPESREFVGMISTIREKLRIGDLAVSRQNWYLKQKYVGRAWLTQDIKAWMDTPRSGKLCAVYGGPGVGKSAFAAQYAYRSPRVAASIFFEHGNEHFNTSGSLIRELIFQLACRLPLYRNRVYGIVTTNDQLKTWNDQELFAHLIKAPLTEFQINGGHETLCIVVDGLDECTVDEQNGVAKLLGKYVQEFPEWLRVLVLSRRESSVMSWLNPDHQIDMVGGEARNLSDIRLYFAETLKEPLKQQPNEERLLDELTKRTEGVFLYAYVVSRMILDGKLALEDTDAYPQGLNSAFREWFSRYFPDVLEYKRLYRLYLGMIAASPEPIPVEELDVVDVRYDAVEDCYQLNIDSSMCGKSGSKQDRLKRINSLLQYRTNKFGKRTVAFSHKYIAEWLTQTDEKTNGSPAGCYYCNPKDALWAMECTWRQKMEEEGLTEYEALHLLDFSQQAERRNVSLQVAQNSIYADWLQKYQSKYNQSCQYELVLPFAICDSERFRQIWENSGSEDDELAWLAAQHRTGVVYNGLGQFGAALAVQEKAYEGLRRIKGDEDQATLRTMGNLSVTYRALGSLERALKLEKKVYETRKRILGYEHSDTLSAMNNLAVTYSALDRLNDALLLEKKVYGTRKRTLGLEHPDTLSIMVNLASTYRNLGYLKDALMLEKKVYEVRRRKLGLEHPDTLLAMSNLAVTYRVLDRQDDALQLQAKVYEVSRCELKPEHPSTLTAMNNLALTYSDLGRLNDALVLSKEACKISKRVHGVEHPDTLTAMNTLAVIYSNLGCSDEAIVLEKQVCAARERMLGLSHIATLTAMNNLAVMCGHHNRHEEALKIGEKVYGAIKHVRSVGHPLVQRAMYNLAMEYAELDRYKEAHSVMQQLYETLRNLLGEKNKLTQEAHRRAEEFRMCLLFGNQN